MAAQAARALAAQALAARALVQAVGLPWERPEVGGRGVLPQGSC